MKKIKKFFNLNFEEAINVKESVRQVQARTLLILLLLTFIFAFTSIIQEYHLYGKNWSIRHWTIYISYFVFYQIVVLSLLIASFYTVIKKPKNMYVLIERITLFSVYFLSSQVVLVTIIGMYHGMNIFIICGSTAGYSAMLLLNDRQRILYLVFVYILLNIGVYWFIEMDEELYIQFVVSTVILITINYLIGYFSYTWYTSNKDKTIKLEASQQFQLKMLNQWAKDLNMKPVNLQKETSLLQLNEEVYKLLDEKVASEKELINTLNNLTNANKSLEEYAQAVSHDLKTPLRAISTLAYILDEDYGSIDKEDMGALTGGIIEKTDYMDHLVSDLLVFSEIRDNGSVTSINALDELTNCIELLQVPDNCNINITGNFDNLKMEAKHFHLLVQNLIKNAFTYTEKEKIEIEIVGTNHSDYLEIKFIDNGNGIDVIYHDKIFQLFQSIDKKNTNSTGFGLAMVKKILSLYSGTITLKSEVKKGSTFTVRLKK